MKLPAWAPGTTDLEQIELLCALIRCARPRVVVESGTFLGHSALMMAAECRENGVGHVWTADPVDHGVVGLAEMAGLGPFLTYFRGDFAEMCPERVDFAYIDGSGEGEEGAQLRWEHFSMVLGRLSPGGIVCVDDTLSDDWRDGEGGRSVGRIREKCVNFRFLKGFSVFVEG